MGEYDSTPMSIGVEMVTPVSNVEFRTMSALDNLEGLGKDRKLNLTTKRNTKTIKVGKKLYKAIYNKI